MMTRYYLYLSFGLFCLNGFLEISFQTNKQTKEKKIGADSLSLCLIPICGHASTLSPVALTLFERPLGGLMMTR